MPDSPTVRQFILDLSAAGVIKKDTSLSFAARLFSVPKKDSDKRRVILDLSPLNRFIHSPSFSMATTASVMSLLPVDCFTASIDIKDAFWHVPIARHFQKFLGFRVESQIFTFNALPFGLTTAPRIFTKIMTAAVNHLRQEGICIVAYLDDLLIWAQSPEILSKNLTFSLKFLLHIGWRINWKKSNLIPSQQFRYLGLEWDTVSHSLFVPRDKKKSYIDKAWYLLSCKKVRLRQLQSLAGSLNFASLASPLLKVRLKDLYRLVNRYFKSSPPRSIPLDLRLCILACNRLLKSSGARPLSPPPVSVTAYTDASLTGWGFHFDSVEKSGVWPLCMKSYHINALELSTILLLVKHIRVPKGSHIRVMCDNTTAVNIIRRGGSRSALLNKVMFNIVETLQSKNLFLSANHIQGCMNIVADRLSRQGPIPTEWSLDQEGRDLILSLVPCPQVDLFATFENRVLDCFVSPVIHPQATYVDALTVDWSQWSVIYLFPPTNLILKVLIALRTFVGTAYLIAPRWPNRPWFGELNLRAHSYKKLDCSILQSTQDGIVLAPKILQDNLFLWTLISTPP